MSYHWFNRETILKNARDKYTPNDVKKKAAKYYIVNIEVL